jgi:hypothetical protein
VTVGDARIYLRLICTRKTYEKRKKERVMPEPREEDDIALGLDEEEIEDETYDTLEEKYE